MAKLAVYYERHEGTLFPQWIVIKFSVGEIDWSKDTLYIPIDAPFRRYGRDDFDSDTLSMSVELADLLINPDLPGQFGISLRLLRGRLKKLKCNSEDIQQLIIQMIDMEDVLEMDTRSIYSWR